MDGTRLKEVIPSFEKLAKQNDFYTENLINKISLRRTISELNEIPEQIRSVFLTAADIKPEDHINMQSQFQKHCDSSVSKTINFPDSASRSDVKKTFLLAYKSGCKGVTIYRDNSRPEQVLRVKKKEDLINPLIVGQVEKRPDILQGITEKIRTGYGNLYVTINMRENKPFEVFAHIGKSGYTTMADTEAICRLISLALRSHVPVEKVIDQLRGIGGSNQTFSGGSKVFSIPDAIAQILNRHFGGKATPSMQDKSANEICPECSGGMIFDSGCFTCPICGYSNC